VELEVTRVSIPATADRLRRGIKAWGSCRPDCLLTGKIIASPRATRRLDLTKAMLVSKAVIWRAGSNKVLVRPGKTVRRALHRYEGRPLEVTFLLRAESESIHANRTARTTRKFGRKVRSE
jgi:hypothetical protein